MVKQKYHATPDGVKVCDATQRKCKYQDFSTYEEALHHYNTVKTHEENSATRVREQLIERIQSLPPEKFPTYEFDLMNLDTNLRFRSHVVKMLEREKGVSPELIDVKAKATIVGDNGKTVAMRLSKKHSVNHGTPPTVNTFWELSAGVVGGAPIGRTSYPLMTATDSREFKKGLKSTFDTIYDTTYSDPVKRAEAKRAMIDRVVSMINGIETMERGAVAADSLGFSYFKGSTPDHLVARSGYAEGVFDERTFEQALQSENYKYTVPKVTVQLQDSLSKMSNNYWTLRTDDGHNWTLTTTVNGEKTMYAPSGDVALVASRIRDFSAGYVTPEWHPVSDRYNGSLESNMVDFMNGIGWSVENHKQRVAQNVHERNMEQERRANSGKKKKKLFGLF